MWRMHAYISSPRVIHLFIVKSDVCQLKELIESIKIHHSRFSFFLYLALDPFKTLNNENNILNLTERNIAVIPCELPNGNPRPVPSFTLENNPLDIESKPGRTLSMTGDRELLIASR